MACTFLFSWTMASGQDSTDVLNRASGLIAADKVMEDVLDLNDPVLSIWPSINDLEIESLSAAVLKLRDAYESDRLNADDRTRKILSLISDAEFNEELIKGMIKDAKDADDDAEKDRLENLKDDYELRRKYLKRGSTMSASSITFWS